MTFQGLTIQNARRRDWHPVLPGRRRPGDRLHDDEHHRQRRDLLLLEPGQGVGLQAAGQRRRAAGRPGPSSRTTRSTAASAEGIGLYDGLDRAAPSRTTSSTTTTRSTCTSTASATRPSTGTSSTRRRPATTSRASRSPTRVLPGPAGAGELVQHHHQQRHRRQPRRGIVFWFSGEWSTQALNDQSGLRYDVISNNTLVEQPGLAQVGRLAGARGHDHREQHRRRRRGDRADLPPPGELARAASPSTTTSGTRRILSQAFPVGRQPALDHAGFVTASAQGAGDVLADPAFAGPWTAPPATNLELTAARPPSAPG